MSQAEIVLDTVEFIFAVLRAGLVLPPLAVAVLAFRRLALSRSGNAWIYAITGLLAFFVGAALLPFVILGRSVDPFFIALALLLPFLWVGVVLVCGPGQAEVYDIEDLPLDDAPLLLTDPLPDVRPVFRHHRPIQKIAGTAPRSSSGVMAAAKRMRGNPTSEARRPKALPPPLPDLPFLRT